MYKLIKCFAIVILFIMLFEFFKHGKSIYMPIYYKITGEKSLTDTIDKLDISEEGRIKPYFNKAGLSFLPERITFVALKKEKKLEVWGEKNGEWYFVREYPILAASGKSGPKLKEGDKQVPEGIYDITLMNPNSNYYLAMLIGYPNYFDKQKAKLEERTNLGGDICIHGKNVSTGCLAVGDEAIEELFYVVAKVGMKNVKVVIAPYDFRKSEVNYDSEVKTLWIKELYDNINSELKKFHK